MPYAILKSSRNIAIASLFSLSCLLIGCTLSPDSQSTAAPSSPVRTAPQILPITAKVLLANQMFELEVAKTQQQQAIGLMYRTFLPPNRGMLFPFTPAQPVRFWMKHCKIPLDMVFLHQGKVVSISANVPPCTTEPCPQYGPDVLVDQVIELQSGRAAAIGLKVGDVAKVQFL
jgi:uncharacterized protein